MVSALWKACAADVQDVENVQQLLKEPGVDLEIKGECDPVVHALCAEAYSDRNEIWLGCVCVC